VVVGPGCSHTQEDGLITKETGTLYPVRANAIVML